MSVHLGADNGTQPDSATRNGTHLNRTETLLQTGLVQAVVEGSASLCASLTWLEEAVATEDAGTLLAEGVRRGIEEVLSRSATDPGAAFAPEALAVLALVRSRDKAEYARTFARLSRAGVNMPLLEEALRVARLHAVDLDSPSAVLTRIADGIDLFHDPDDQAYAEIEVAGHFEVRALGGKAFRRYLAHQYYVVTEKSVSSHTLSDAMTVLEGRALYAGPARDVPVRVARHQHAILIDMCDPEWRVIEVTRDGWRILDRSPVPFRRSKGARPLPEPARGGSLDLLWPLVNVPEGPMRALAAGWLLGALRETGPYPMLVIQGQQGAAKSSTSRLLSGLVDPRRPILRSLPREERDLAIAGRNSWVLAYDNLSGLSPWIADAMCRLATGGGFATRELYANDEEMLFDSQRPLLLNGIDDLLSRPDLADRSVVIHLPTIPERNRRAERRLIAEYADVQPLVLGALLDAVAHALRHVGEVRLPTLPRMADFCEWVVAGETALGLQPGEFLAAYEANRAQAVEQTVDASPVGGAVLSLMAAHPGGWSGTATELQARLASLVTEDTHRSRDWPRDPRSLANAMRRLAPALRALGITAEYERQPGGNRQRTWTIRRT